MLNCQKKKKKRYDLNNVKRGVKQQISIIITLSKAIVWKCHTYPKYWDILTADHMYPKICITKTYLCNVDPLKPYFYIVKLGFTGVHIIFLILLKKHRLWVLVRTASSGRFYRVPTIYVLSRNMKNIRIFCLKIFLFLVVKSSIYTNRRVFVMEHAHLTTWVNTVDLDQMPQNSASDQDDHRLPLTQPFWKQHGPVEIVGQVYQLVNPYHTE